jgi:hypothetical protein
VTAAVLEATPRASAASASALLGRLDVGVSCHARERAALLSQFSC